MFCSFLLQTACHFVHRVALMPMCDKMAVFLFNREYTSLFSLNKTNAVAFCAWSSIKGKKNIFFRQKKCKIFFYIEKMCNFAPHLGIGLWCNGNTADSGPAFPGSSPGSPTIKVLLLQNLFLSFIGCVVVKKGFFIYKMYIISYICRNITNAE